jgi:hypothetical protein
MYLGQIGMSSLLIDLAGAMTMATAADSTSLQEFGMVPQSI